MPSMSACLLGSINLSEYVINPFTKDAYVDIHQLEKDVEIYVEALNECLEENTPFMPLKEQEEAARKYRAIGLGYFGVGDMFIKLGIRYGSKESLEIADNIGYIVARSAIKSSAILGDKKVFPTPDILADNPYAIIGSEFYQNHFHKTEPGYIPCNTSLLTCAPTGSLSTMLGVSGGIEPIFSLKMWRKTESLNGGKETHYEVDVPVVNEWKKVNNTAETPEWIEKSVALKQNINERITMQGIWQKHIDNAISSTVNLPEEATIEEVENLYLDAWSAGLKGVTIYRTGCKRGAILSEKKKEEPIEEIVQSKPELKWGDTLSCSDELIGLKRKIMSGCGSLHVEAFYNWDGVLQEVFFNKGSDGGCNSFMSGLSRMTSLAARTGANIDKIIDQFNSVPACPSYVARTATKHDTSKGRNCPSAIGNALIDMQIEIDRLIKKGDHPIERSINKLHLIEETNKATSHITGKKTEQQCIDEGICPLCYNGGEIVELSANGGCYSCLKCGFSKCE